ncbi:MAG: glycosyltransferase family 2 protein [Candidatus Devosia phytovorans]|uniref:Glycosyltransferase family 2 protein n=1 Tax=Candidatus Devosia phytovorans TaxID=3121372 RepID=A0AAJ5VT69_9HYPH|nr:glycosyltransferase family 2 protein [Devosia sp.]WEK03715.1 MAG: glycosyltransferase family 2 protein [Devosia sp.]
MHELTIAIVNYRTAHLTIDCLASIIADPFLPASTRVMVVDGVSGDGSGELIRSAIADNGWTDRIACIDLPINGGFAYGNNQAIHAADTRWDKARAYLLLNPDTLVRPGAIGHLVQFLARHADAGIVGSLLEDPDGTPQACSFRFPSALGEFEGEARLGPVSRLLDRWRVVLPIGASPSRADWVSGASMLVRREVLDQIGELDDGYFLYYEELDFCRRAADAGWQCWTVPQSHVVHLCGQSTGVSSREPRRLNRRPAYWFNSRNRYFEKHHSRIGKFAIDLAWMAGQSIWHLRQLLQRRPNNDPPFLVRDFLASLSPWASK